MNRSELLSTWESARNSKWQTQEAFVKLLIHELASARSFIETCVKDKYVGYQQFKHIEGNVRELGAQVLDGLESKIELALK